MKTYSSLSIDVIHFEAQDVITSSTALDTHCICVPGESACHYHYDRASRVSCTADVHKHNCNSLCIYIN